MHLSNLMKRQISLTNTKNLFLVENSLFYYKSTISLDRIKTMVHLFIQQRLIPVKHLLSMGKYRLVDRNHFNLDSRSCGNDSSYIIVKPILRHQTSGLRIPVWIKEVKEHG
jgi:hypothetical protein